MTIDYLTDFRDKVVFGETPIFMQPRFGTPLAAPDDVKHRFVCGEDGLYIEAQNAVIAVRVCVARSSVRLPYGKIEHSGIHLKNGLIPYWILNETLKKAGEALPDEWAGIVVWNGLAQQYELYSPTILLSNPARVSYSSSVPDHLIPVMDLHSHGAAPAFFSVTDNESDLAGFYVAGVIGDCASGHPSVMTRMVVNGHFLHCPDLSMFFADSGRDVK